MNAHRIGAFDLGAKFTLGVVGLYGAIHLGSVGPEIALGIEQAGNFVLGFDRAPPISFPFAGEGEVQSEVGVGMALRVVSHFVDPRAGDHNAGGRGGVAVEGIEAGNVFGVGDGEVVGVNDEELGIARVAEALGGGLGLGPDGGQG